MSVAQGGPASTGRVFLGVALLVAVVGALAVARGVAGPDVSGKAIAAALPPAPTAGSCLETRLSDMALASPVDELKPVRCSAPHSAEVFSASTLADGPYPITEAGPQLKGTRDFDHSQRVCHDGARRYLGEFDHTARWRVPPQVYVKVMVPTVAAWNLGQRWFGCQAAATAGDPPTSFSGTLRVASASPRPPDLLGTCGSKVGDDRVPCTAPHRAEKLLAEPAPGRLEQVLNAEVRPVLSCDRNGASVIGAADPTYGGRLALVELVEPQERSCWITTTDGTTLTSSMIGHGERPLATG